MKKISIIILWILLVNSFLFSEIQFNYEVALEKYDFGEVRNIKMLDIDNDSIDEYCIEYANESFIRQVIYNTDGDTLKIFKKNNMDNISSSIGNLSGLSYYVEASEVENNNQNYIGVSIYDFNEVLIDSISVLFNNSIFGGGIVDWKPISITFSQTDSLLSIFVGILFEEYMATSSGVSSLTMHVSFDSNSLNYVFDYPIYSILDQLDNESFVAYAFDSWNGEGSYYYAHRLRLIDISNQSTTSFYNLSVNYMEDPTQYFGFDLIDNSHYYENNEDLIFVYKSYVNDEYLINIVAQDINSQEIEWIQTNLIAPDEGIVSSTVFNHPNGNDYLLYFLPSSACMRNLENGLLWYQEISPITPQYILEDNANEKRYFQVLSNATIVYTIVNIEVSADNDNVEFSHLEINNYPNPFNPSTTIEFSILNDSNVELLIYNIKGQKINTLVQDSLTKGSHSINWNGKNDNGKSVSSGLYYYTLKVNGKTEAVNKCMLLK